MVARRRRRHRIQFALGTIFVVLAKKKTFLETHVMPPSPCFALFGAVHDKIAVVTSIMRVRRILKETTRSHLAFSFGRPNELWRRWRLFAKPLSTGRLADFNWNALDESSSLIAWFFFITKCVLCSSRSNFKQQHVAAGIYSVKYRETVKPILCSRVLWCGGISAAFEEDSELNGEHYYTHIFSQIIVFAQQFHRPFNGQFIASNS